MSTRKKSKSPRVRFPRGRTLAQMEALSDQAEREFGLDEMPSTKNPRPHPKKQGRAAVLKSHVVDLVIRVSPELLRAVDDRARKAGLTRSGVIDQSLRAILKTKPGRITKRKSA